jgi:hypothetical protein
MNDEELMTGYAGDAEVGRRLEAFAGTRLSPDPEAMRRVRTRVMAEAHRRSAGRTDATARALPPAPVGRWRRGSAALIAASLAVAVAAGSVAGSQAGGVLYDARLWVEELVLPTDPGERIDRQVARLEARMTELRRAGVVGDPHAAAAALDAFAEIVAEIEAAERTDPAAARRAAQWLARNQAVLAELLAIVPTQARPAIEHAMERSSHAAGRLGGGRPDRPGAAPGVPGPSTTRSPGRPSPKPTRVAGTPVPPKATKTPSPNKPTAKPTAKPTPTPSATPVTSTPRPTKSPSPNKPTAKPDQQSHGQQGS